MPARTRLIAAALGVVVMATAPPGDARMYQWSHSASGRVQLSGTPPAWYRSVRQGPRVLVFDNGVLVDDTAIEVPETRRQALRAAAFGDGNTEEAAVATAPEPRAMLREALETAAQDGVDVEAVAEEFTEEQTAAARGSVEQTVAELKSLLEEWDNRRVNEAKELLRDVDAAAP